MREKYVIYDYINVIGLNSDIFRIVEFEKVLNFDHLKLKFKEMGELPGYQM